MGEITLNIFIQRTFSLAFYSKGLRLFSYCEICLEKKVRHFQWYDFVPKIIGTHMAFCGENLLIKPRTYLLIYSILTNKTCSYIYFGFWRCICLESWVFLPRNISKKHTRYLQVISKNKEMNSRYQARFT